ncbi:hypothetical protein AB0X62_02105 [Ligilactobacillus salivarius]|uniref:hypothetical protein n=1 Tax=Ligilactobacillus salivarius TaxID=1624 RepID=UPI003F220C5A
MPNVTTTYERWLNRNKSKMDSWLRGTDPGTIRKKENSINILKAGEKRRKNNLTEL